MSDTPQNDPAQVDKLALRRSQAGMRFIAQMTIYNSGNWERLHQFIRDSYSAEQLDQQPAEGRLRAFQTTAERAGKLRVKQVLATNEHHVIVAMEAEKLAGAFFYVELQVEEDYPHKITAYMMRPLTPVEGE